MKPKDLKHGQQLRFKKHIRLSRDDFMSDRDFAPGNVIFVYYIDDDFQDGDYQVQGVLGEAGFLIASISNNHSEPRYEWEITEDEFWNIYEVVEEDG